MKNYGMNKATEFCKGNINFIYKNAKQGNIEIERWLISKFYDLADYYGPDYNGCVEQDENQIKRILTALEEEDYEEAQEIIDFMNSKQNLYSKKIQDKMNHETIGSRPAKEEAKEEKTIEVAEKEITIKAENHEAVCKIVNLLPMNSSSRCDGSKHYYHGEFAEKIAKMENLPSIETMKEAIDFYDEVMKSLKEKVDEVEDAYMKIYAKENVVVDGKVTSQYERLKTIDITGETVEAEIEKCESKGWLYEISGLRNDEVIRIGGNI